MTETRDRARQSGSAFRVRLLEERIGKLRRVTEDVAEDRAQNNSYELGKANGLILARHIMEGRSGSPAYL